MDKIKFEYEEREPKLRNGILALVLIILWFIISMGLIILSGFLGTLVLIPLGIIGLIASFISLFGYAFIAIYLSIKHRLKSRKKW